MTAPFVTFALYIAKFSCILSITAFPRNCKGFFHIFLIFFRLRPVPGLDRPADLIEQFPGHRAGSATQVVEDGGGGEFSDPRQIAVLHKFGGVQAAAGEDGVLDASCEHVPEADFQIEVIQLLQQTVLHVISQIGQAVPVDLVYRPRRQLHDLFPDIPIPGGAVPPFQRVQHGGMVVLPHFPQVGRFGPLHRAGIRHVKDVFQGGPAPPVLADEGDALGAGLHPPPHGLVPQFHAGAGGGVGPLGVDQELFVKGIFE